VGVQVDPSSVLSDFRRDTFTALGRTRDVYRMGEGPTVLVLSEMPGITPSVAAFARRVASRGLSVAMPHLFGTDGAEPTNAQFRRTLREVCVSREFTLFATSSPSSVTQWLTELAKADHQRTGGPGVGVVGMCLTGGFALAMMVDPVVVAPVLSQPSLPAPLGRRRARADLGITDEQRRRVVARAQSGQCVIGLRFTGDALAPAERFAALRDLLGDKFIGVEIDSSPGNPWGYKEKAHSVLTEDLGENPDSPTTAALEQVLTFVADQLDVTNRAG
jgi:dienelactone hydrolase